MPDGEIRKGDRIFIRDACGDWHEVTADSGVEGTHVEIPGRGRRMRKIHDFPVVWIKFDLNGPRMPWPAADVKPWEDVDDA